MCIISVLYDDKKPPMECLRWIALPKNAEQAGNLTSWTLGIFRDKKKHSLEVAGGKLLNEDAFTTCLNNAIPQDFEAGALRKEQSPDCAYWVLANAKRAAITQKLLLLHKRYLVLPNETTPPNATIERYYLEAAQPDGPLCLTTPNQAMEQTVMTAESGEDNICLASLVCPAYWPVARVFVNTRQRQLIRALRAAGATEASTGNDTTKPKLITLLNGSTFVRDNLINLLHGCKGHSTNKSLATTKNEGNGFNDNNWVLGFQKTDVPVAILESGFGFGGNFLSAECADRIVLFHGGCTHQAESFADDRFMIGTLLTHIGGNRTVVRIDTGWLKVGHVDEILSFPKSGVALLASPTLYKELAKEELEEIELNEAIAAKLKPVEETLTSLKFKVYRLPVWFCSVKSDPRHVTSLIGNAVNCIYMGLTSLHSHSGRTAPANETEFEPQGSVDEFVRNTMANLGFERSLFVDMQQANNEGGAGGNVHCATYTIHFFPD